MHLREMDAAVFLGKKMIKYPEVKAVKDTHFRGQRIRKKIAVKSKLLSVFIRPGVAGAVLQTTLLLIKLAS